MDPTLTAAAALFGVLSHPARLQVLTLLQGDRERTASELQAATGLERTAMSHQLRILREAHLVHVTPVGRQRRYRLADHHVAHIVRDALAHVQEPPCPQTR